MKTCVCKVELIIGQFKFEIGNKYKYEISSIEAYDQIFNMYKVHTCYDYTNFIEFDFKQYFYSEKELRKEKLEKLKNV